MSEGKFLRSLNFETYGANNLSIDLHFVKMHLQSSAAMLRRKSLSGPNLVTKVI